MLPMLLSSASDAFISAARLKTFICLPEKDPGLVVNYNDLSDNEKEKLADKIENNIAIKVTGNPSFTWSLAKDK